MEDRIPREFRNIPKGNNLCEAMRTGIYKEPYRTTF